jgi:hypothetical protein
MGALLASRRTGKGRSVTLIRVFFLSSKKPEVNDLFLEKLFKFIEFVE